MVQVLKLVAQLALVRLLDLEGFGIYATALAVCAVIETASTARSMEVAMNRLPARIATIAPEDWSYAGLVRGMRRTEALWIGGAFGVVLTVAAVYAAIADRQTAIAIVLAGLSIPALFGYGIANGVCLLAADFRALARAEITGAMVGTATMIAGAVIAGVEGALIGYAAPLVLRNLLLTRYAAQGVAARTPADFVTAAPAGPPGLAASGQAHTHAFIGAGLNALYQNIDVIVLSLIGSPAVVAVYRVAKLLARLGGDLFEPVWKAARPDWLQRFYAGDIRGLMQLMRRLMLPMLAASALSVVLTLQLAPWFLDLAFGADFRAAAAPLTVLILGQAAAQVLAGWASFWVVAEARFRRRNLLLLALCAIAGTVPFMLDIADPLIIAGIYATTQAMFAAAWWIMLLRAVAHGR